jgi:N-acetylglucosaminyl-diphospho-decaprenol L-rhamnosyltransferase
VRLLSSMTRAPITNGLQPLADVAVIVVSTNEARWLRACLSTVYEHAGDATLEVIVVENACTDETRELVETEFPQARVVTSANRGFGHGNNRGLEQARARYVLLLNPDTEVLEGTFGELVRLLDARPQIGLAGVRQLNGDRSLGRTIRRFPSVTRMLGDALISDRWPVHPSWSSERVLDRRSYERECECDWTSGSFMLVRREALLGAGLLDERFFIYSEEPDLCMRIKRGGWRVCHLPAMTIVHHAGKGGVRPRMEAQEVYARKQYARKYFSAPYRFPYFAAIALKQLVRFAAACMGRDDAGDRRAAAWLSLRTLVGLAPPPFGPPPATAIVSAPPSSHEDGAAVPTAAAGAPAARA